MKTNYERNSIHISQIVRNILLLSILALTGLYSAAWKVEEAPSIFTYNWKVDQEDLTEFVKSGKINSGISGSLQFEGRYYPVYTSIIENTPEEISYRISESEQTTIIAKAIKVDIGDIDPSANDVVDPSVLNSFVNLKSIPGIGTLVEIMPFLPNGDGTVKCLKNAKIQILSTASKTLNKSDLQKDKTKIAKSLSSKADLPAEFCALYIEEEGVFQVSGQDLLDHGIDIRNINPDNIKLYWWGEELPCRVTSTYKSGQETFQAQDVIQFYIPEKKNPYGDYKYNPFSDFDVIHLYWNAGNGLRYVQENSEIDASISSADKFSPEENRTFRSTVHIEKNQLYQNLARLHEDELSHKYEHEFYTPAIKIGKSVSFPFELWDPQLDSPYNVDFTIRMQGLTYSVDDEMDHQILVEVNNQYLLEDEWDGQVPKISTNEDMQFAHENLINGENNIEISVKGFQSNPYLDDQVLFDWLEISYDRYMIVHNNRLKFSPQHGPGTYLFEIKGLTSATNILILKNETNWIRGYSVEQKTSSEGDITYSIYFEDLCDGSESYQIAGSGMKDVKNFGIESIDSIRYVNVQENDHYNYNNEGDYVIITHKDFFEKAKELAEHKADIGFTPVIYELERIYDEYNDGNESPYAIKNFLSEIYADWNITPQYVLLIGDTGTDNPLPIIKYQSSGAIGSVIADNWFADIDDDFVLEMALGRLPVSTEDELDSIISKIEIFDTMLPPKQRNRMALISGPESTFKIQIQNSLNSVFPDQIQTDRLYLYDSQVTGDFDAGVYATDSLVNIINNGVFAINYLGHGGGYTWDNYVLPYEAFDRFKPGHPFIVNSMTCFTNTFSNDNALGEMFVRHPRGGVSVLSSTGYGWINSNYFLFEKIMEHMIDDHMSHGQALQFALTDYFFSTFGRNANFMDQVDGQIIYKYFRKTLFYQNCILGDPSATFPSPLEGSVNLSSKSVSSNQNITLTVPESGIVKGYLDVVGTKGNSRKYPVQQKINLSFDQGTTNINIPGIPDNIYDGILQLTYWDDDKNTYTALASIAMDSPYISSLEFFPHQPRVQDPAITIRLQLETYNNVDSLRLRVFPDRYITTGYKILSMKNIGNGIFELDKPIIYSSATSFYSVLSDSTTPSEYYTGSYFMPEIFESGVSFTGDYYYLTPIKSPNKDISILDYSVENGQSKLILINETDTSVYVKVNLTVTQGSFNYTMSDTVLTTHNVDSQYEEGFEKVNTLYYDFLPALGNSNITVSVMPLYITDADTTNNILVKNINNKWINFNNGHMTNNVGDTASYTDYLINHIMPVDNSSFKGSVYINNYKRSYNLSDFGATQSGQDVVYVNSKQDELGILGSVPISSFADGEFIAYLSVDLSVFYRLPVVQADSNYIFPIQAPGYYLKATSIDNIEPEIELNINARELLTRGYVSERSDFSIIMTDDHGINPLVEFWDILLDDNEIPDEDILVINNDNVEQLEVNFKLSMDPGSHTLQVVAHDLVGNKTQTEKYDIIYTGESELINYGTYPNPFTTKTTFIYELTEQFDDVTIKIFTLSGKKIYTMSVSENSITDLPLYSIGYHEIPWYGRDEFGNTVANGVYFYKIEGEVDGKKIKSTGKIAKLR